MSTDQTIGQMIEAKDMKFPRITPADIQANIVSEHYFTAADGVDGADIQKLREQNFDVPLTIQALKEEVNTSYTQTGPLGLLTFCVLVLKNGFTVTGESACASPENFNAEIGRAVARRNAIDKIWPLMGYALKQKMHEEMENK